MCEHTPGVLVHGVSREGTFFSTTEPNAIALAGGTEHKVLATVSYTTSEVQEVQLGKLDLNLHDINTENHNTPPLVTPSEITTPVRKLTSANVSAPNTMYRRKQYINF